MAYQSLYRKYRPQRFGELVGQEHVTNALRNAVRDGRVGHAYLFSGPRGTGKTTTARILAKALNCQSLGDDAEPCGACANCLDIAEGRVLDIRELDAASNRGIDNIRDVIESTFLGLAPNARVKMFVLDEVHMLTEPASNALLKTLEEAPTHVVFVLATTNPERVLPTLRSRTQHFEFTLLPTEAIAAHLGDICGREGVEADPEALATVAAAGEGSVRDALSLLDQALAHGTARLEGAAVAALFGGSPVEVRTRILEALASEDTAGALVALGELLESGHEPRRAAEDLLTTARDAFLLTAASGRVRVDTPADEQERLRACGTALGNAALVRTIETLGQAVVDMRAVDAADPRLVLEVALVRVSRRDAGPPLQTVMERLERLERAVAGGTQRTAGSDESRRDEPRREEVAASSRSPRRTLGALRREAAAAGAAEPASPLEAAPAPPSAPAPAPPTAPSAPPGADRDGPPAPLDLDDVVLAWGAIVPGLPVATRSAVQNAQPVSVEGDVVVFGVAPALLDAARPRFKREADTIRTALGARLGRTLKFNLVAAPEVALDAEQGVSAEGPDEPSPVGSDDPSPGGSGGSTTVSLLQEQLGATVVEEHPRDAPGG